MDKILLSNDPLFIYKKDGIIMNKGSYKGFNLSKNYIVNKTDIIHLLDDIADENIKHIKDIMKMIKEDLENGF